MIDESIWIFNLICAGIGMIAGVGPLGSIEEEIEKSQEKEAKE